MPSLTELFDTWPYQSDLGWHSEKRLREQLEILDELSPGTPESPNPDYWMLRGQVFLMISSNALEQFSRGKYEGGMLTKDHFEGISEELDDRERKAGFDLYHF